MIKGKWTIFRSTNESFELDIIYQLIKGNITSKNIDNLFWWIIADFTWKIHITRLTSWSYVISKNRPYDTLCSIKDIENGDDVYCINISNLDNDDDYISKLMRWKVKWSVLRLIPDVER